MCSSLAARVKFSCSAKTANSRTASVHVLPDLVGRFDGRVWLVSKCGERVQQRTLAWLDHHHFYDRTGIPRDHVRFCRARPEKADHCAELAITDFIDDRVDVMAALRSVVDRRYLFGPQRKPVPADVIATPTWSAVAEAVRTAASLLG